MDQIARELIAEHLAVPVEKATDRALSQHDLGDESQDLVQLTTLLEERFDAQRGDEESAPA